jgi:hypothetical protein
MPSRLEPVLWGLGFPVSWSFDIGTCQEAYRAWGAAFEHEGAAEYGIVRHALDRQRAERELASVRRARTKLIDRGTYTVERKVALKVGADLVAEASARLDGALDDYRQRSAATEACVVRQNLAIFRVLAHRQLAARKAPAPREVAHAP